MPEIEDAEMETDGVPVVISQLINSIVWQEVEKLSKGGETWIDKTGT